MVLMLGNSTYQMQDSYGSRVRSVTGKNAVGTVWERGEDMSQPPIGFRAISSPVNNSSAPARKEPATCSSPWFGSLRFWLDVRRNTRLFPCPGGSGVKGKPGPDPHGPGWLGDLQHRPFMLAGRYAFTYFDAHLLPRDDAVDLVSSYAVRPVNFGSRFSWNARKPSA